MSEEVDLGLRLSINHDFSGDTVGQHYKLNRRIGVGGIGRPGGAAQESLGELIRSQQSGHRYRGSSPASS